MYEKSARFYDEIYSYKDYGGESKKVHRLIGQYKTSRGNTLLDVACGTGNHIDFLKRYYKAEGMDLNKGMLRRARKKHPDIVFHQADMTSFRLGKKYDVITCLFSGIGHVKTEQNLRKTLASMAAHLRPGGVVIVEPWISPRRWRTGTIHSTFVDKPKLKIARISVSGREGRFSLNWMHYLVATPEGVEYFVERLRMGLFTRREYERAFRRAGLRVHYDSKGLSGRGLYIGTIAA